MTVMVTYKHDGEHRRRNETSQVLGSLCQNIVFF